MVKRRARQKLKIKWAKEIEDGLMGRGRLIGALGQKRSGPGSTPAGARDILGENVRKNPPIHENETYCNTNVLD